MLPSSSQDSSVWVIMNRLIANMLLYSDVVQKIAYKVLLLCSRSVTMRIVFRAQKVMETI